MTPRRPLKDAIVQRIRSLIALDASNVIERLTRRREEMVSLFSRLRDRGPILAAVESWFTSVTFSELALLEPNEQFAVNGFYELLGDLRWYAKYTEDMPLQVQLKLDRFAGDLSERQRVLLAVLGTPVSKGAVVEVAPTLAALAPQGRPRKARLSLGGARKRRGR